MHSVSSPVVSQRRDQRTDHDEKVSALCPLCNVLAAVATKHQISCCWSGSQAQCSDLTSHSLYAATCRRCTLSHPFTCKDIRDKAKHTKLTKESELAAMVKQILKTKCREYNDYDFDHEDELAGTKSNLERADLKDVARNYHMELKFAKNKAQSNAMQNDAIDKIRDWVDRNGSKAVFLVVYDKNGGARRPAWNQHHWAVKFNTLAPEVKRVVEVIYVCRPDNEN